ncbi:relaxase/mobilization nuclease domain-containing protein [uncultured Tolumonas sp.]|uniref:relaxase/mobilization nuclease domain-containing protein n=1 Tax=uncultured Tolumonas sp. TaxID=263765 RepID=UPI002A0A24A5|nr:relaxase/mobilization nuclease domain-containing protein [uncultured Tolumonas sp.]
MINEIISCKNKSGNRADAKHMIEYVFGLTKEHIKSTSIDNSVNYICSSLINLPDPTLVFNGDEFQRIPAHNANISGFIQDIEKQASLNPAVKTPFKHFIISLPCGEELTHIQWQDVAKTFMKEMGYQHCKYIVTKHNDTDNQHIHIAACTVQNVLRHPVVNQWQEKVKATNLMRTFEIKYGLQTVVDPFDGKRINNKERFPIKDQMRIYINAAIKRCAQSGNDSLPDLIKILGKMDIHCYIQFQNGKAKGICYRFNEMSVPGGKLGANRRYTLPGLIEQGITYIPARDNPTLEYTNKTEKENRPFAPRELPDVSPTQQSSKPPALPPMASGYSYFYLCLQISKSKVRCLKTKTRRPNYIRSNGINAVLFYLCKTKAERDQLKLIQTIFQLFSAIFGLDQDLNEVEPHLETDLMLESYSDWKALTRFEDATAESLTLPSALQTPPADIYIRSSMKTMHQARKEKYEELTY